MQRTLKPSGKRGPYTRQIKVVMNPMKLLHDKSLREELGDGNAMDQLPRASAKTPSAGVQGVAEESSVTGFQFSEVLCAATSWTI